MFNIRKGKYVVPGVGKVDAYGEVDAKVALQLYESKAFPWCEPVIGKKTVDFLKKQKLDEKRIAALIQTAKSKEEVDMLLEVKSNKALEGIANTKKESFSNKS
ncbi:hypothetical protein [Flagellimonas sp.]|uniref:hypothetical protein n=1 Tax=Flagellimonas sp. TaxID=2058762 RepID=UPI003BAD80B0